MKRDTCIGFQSDINNLILQWIYYIPTKDEKPTILYAVSLNTLLCLTTSAVNEGGSGNLFAQDITTSSVKLYRGFSGTNEANLVKNRIYSCMIIGRI